MRSILLTGSGGFIGQNIKRYFADDYHLLTPRSFELDLTDVQNVDRFFKENKVDMIIHSAAKGVRINQNDNEEDVTIPNVKMFRNLARHVSAQCPMIIFGSGAEYNKELPIIDVKENSFGQSVPQDPYGKAKYIISKEIEHSDYILNMRLFGVYGCGEHPSRVTTSMIKDNLKHHRIYLNQNVKYSFIDIDDLCFILKSFVDNFPKEKFINVASDTKIEIKELAEIVNKISDYQSEIIFKNSGMNKEYTCNTQILNNYFPNYAFTSYDKGLYKLMNFLKGEK